LKCLAVIFKEFDETTFLNQEAIGNIHAFDMVEVVAQDVEAFVCDLESS